MKTEHLKKFKSSNVASAQYDGAKKELQVGFNSGHEYSYSDVKKSEWTGLQKAKSKGHYLYAHVEHEHKFTRLK